MAGLTSRELAVLQNRLDMEKLLIQKYKLYSRQVQDPQIKNKCEQIAAKHQTHYDKLLQQLK